MNVVRFVLLAALLHCAYAETVVRIRDGLLNGTKTRTRNGREFSAFNGIPYAEPPTGSRRFRNPVPKKPWAGVLRAQKDGSQCPQISENGVVGNEDCLYLNVYTPQIYQKENSLLPVMVYIHGGAYAIGNGSSTEVGPGYLLDKNIVLVVMNYRLGILGFLSTGDTEAPGNFGLKDQSLALKWVQRNIKAFGGDPTKVTLFGESAGGSSTNLHALSKQSKHLFHRYIIQSGSALCPWAFRRNQSYYEYPAKIAKKYNCAANNSASIINCLRKLSVEQLLNTTDEFSDVFQQLLTMWGPTIEPHSHDAFLTDTPENLMRKNQMKNSPMISGVVNDEGLPVSTYAYVNEKFYQALANDPLSVISGTFKIYEPMPEANITDMSLKMKNFYFGAEMPNEKDEVINRYTEFISDLMFLYPQMQMMQQRMRCHADSVYFYNFNYRGTFSHSLKVTGGNKTYGVSHADDLIYLFPLNASNFGVSESLRPSKTDYKVVDLMVDLWTSFASNSVPISNELDHPSLWQPYKFNNSHLEIGNGRKVETTLQHSFQEARMKFWYKNGPQFFLDSC